MPACDRGTGTCACTSSCSRRGSCCQCVAFHRGRGEAPAYLHLPEELTLRGLVLGPRHWA